jgi:hypothetical protein
VAFSADVLGRNPAAAEQMGAVLWRHDLSAVFAKDANAISCLQPAAADMRCKFYCILNSRGSAEAGKKGSESLNTGK